MEEWLKLLEHNDRIGIKRYLAEGADVNTANEHDESVLALALKMHCDEEVIDLLIESGADLEDFDEEGVGIFDYAITYNAPKLFGQLLASGIDVNKTMRRSRFTPLMAAVCYSRVEMAKQLLEAGADPKARDHKGFSAADFARKMRKNSMMQLLEQYER